MIMKNIITLPAKEIQGLRNKAYSDGYNSTGDNFDDLVFLYSSEKSKFENDEFWNGVNDAKKDYYNNMPSWELGYGML